MAEVKVSWTVHVRVDDGHQRAIRQMVQRRLERAMKDAWKIEGVRETRWGIDHT